MPTWFSRSPPAPRRGRRAEPARWYNNGVRDADYLLGRTYRLDLLLDARTFGPPMTFTVQEVGDDVLFVVNHATMRREAMPVQFFRAGIDAGLISDALAAPYGG